MREEELNELEKLYEDFQKEFPLERLRNLTIDEYTNLEKTSFCYWLEAKTEKIASIWGGSSYKFGIYRWQTKPSPDGTDSKYGNDENYAWLRKYGNTANEAYQKVLDLVVSVAENAINGNFAAIDDIDLGNVYKWKIAFMYSNKKLVNILSPEGIKWIAKKEGIGIDNPKIFEIQKFLIDKKGGENIFAYGERLWSDWLSSEEYKMKTEKNNYWLINPKNEGSLTDTSEIDTDYVLMGWNKNKCPKFYNDVKTNDIIVVCEGAHSNNKCHYAGIADRLDENEKCWYLKNSTTEYNSAISEIIKKSPSDFAGGNSSNPWALTKSIIKLGNNSSEKKLKIFLQNIFETLQGDTTMPNPNDKIENYTKLLQTNRNLILTGAPGTGKTHLAKEIAKAMSAEYKLVQFHPSYDYTDFVEGLRPIGDDGQVGFERTDGVFKKFCKKAKLNSEHANSNLTDRKFSNFDEVYDSFIEDLSENDLQLKTKHHQKEFSVIVGIQGGLYAVPKTDFQTKMPINKEKIQTYLESKLVLDWKSYLIPICEYIENNYELKIDKSVTKPNNFVFIIDEINRGEISKIFGELFFSIDPGYRGVDGLVQTQYQNLVKDKDLFKKGFYVPENVYIIGTMNDIDRSVESMDFAFRRRFAFCEITASENVGMLDALGDLKDDAVNRMNNLNVAIEQIEGLSSAYHIGASYFLKLKNYDGDFDGLWQYHIEGLLREYLRGNPEIEKLIGDLKTAYNLGNSTDDRNDG